MNERVTTDSIPTQAAPSEAAKNSRNNILARVAQFPIVRGSVATIAMAAPAIGFAIDAQAGNDAGSDNRGANVLKLEGEDMCKNIADIQWSVPIWAVRDANGNCFEAGTTPVAGTPTGEATQTVTPHDSCPNIPGQQNGVPIDKQVDSQGNCVPKPIPPTGTPFGEVTPGPDFCQNLPGRQETIPAGLVEGPNHSCVPPEATPTPQPTATPTREVTATPTPQPTATPTREATATPTPQPTATPTREATATPTRQATATPTSEATATPTPKPEITPVPPFSGNGSKGNGGIKFLLAMAVAAAGATAAGTLGALKGRKS